MADIDCDTMMQVVREIYKATRSQSPETFQDVVLEKIKTILAFDHCKWGTGFLQNGEMRMHTLHQYNFPNHTAEEYINQQSQDFILERLIAERIKVTTVDRYDLITREDFVQRSIYQDYCQKYRLEQLISTIIPEPLSNLFSVISFSRSDYNRPFSAADKKIKTIIAPVLTEARSHNIFINMIQTDHRHRHCSAIADPKGLLIESEPHFSKLMVQEWPSWQGPKLAFIPEQLLQGQSKAVYSGKSINIHLSTLDDHLLLQAKQKSPLDNLTSAEKSVSDLLLQGLADKSIANKLGISPKTVGHHLQHIYKKTALPNRGLLMAALRNEE